ncbi:hypothetical protein ScPMuIL_006076 [Solemya velum]
MAATREKRHNAGSKMAKLLNEEEEDDFYKNTYGGFTEDDNDDEYQSENSESDMVDSDFSIEENDEVKSDVDDEDGPKRRKKLVTKAYREPVKKKPKPEEKKKSPKHEKTKAQPSSVQIYHSPEKKSVRKSTLDKSKAVANRQQQREARAKMLKDFANRKNIAEVRRLTQEELLAEAKITEELNLKSLANYEKLELEKKKSRIQKQVYKGPLLRYHSLTMPLIEELPGELEINVDGDSNESNKRSDDRVSPTGERCSRTFITFTDERIFRDCFPQKKLKPTVKQYCPVTRQPAKYFDPITQTPYATIKAFKYIRKAYAQQLSESENKKTKQSAPTELSVTS